MLLSFIRSLQPLLFFLSALAFSKGEDDRIARNYKILQENVPTVIYTNSGVPDSFDPLRATVVRNSRLMRLLYATPIQVDKGGAFYSQLFQSFTAENAGVTLRLTLRPNLCFADGTPLTLKDVAQSLARVLYFKPEIKPLDVLKGVDTWLKRPHPLQSLPEGIVLNFKDNVLELHFSQAQPNPWEQLSLQMFAVIPAACVDAISGQLKCSVPPASGRYRLKLNADHHFIVERRAEEKRLPPRLHLLYLPAIHLIKYLHAIGSNHVIIANSSDIDPSHLKTLTDNLRDTILPETSFFALLLNKKHPLFADLRTRQYFARQFRQCLRQEEERVEGSIFSRLLPGYVPLVELENKIAPFSEKEEAKILERLRHHPITWQWHSNNWEDLYLYYLRFVFNHLKVKDRQITIEAEKVGDLSSWKNGEIALRPTFYSFSGSDPNRDVRRFFSSPIKSYLVDLNSHPFISKQLDALSVLGPQPRDISILQDLNSHIFAQAEIAVLTNFAVHQFTTLTSKLFIGDTFSDDPTHYFYP